MDRRAYIPLYELVPSHRLKGSTIHYNGYTYIGPYIRARVRVCGIVRARVRVRVRACRGMGAVPPLAYHGTKDTPLFKKIPYFNPNLTTHYESFHI